MTIAYLQDRRIDASHDASYVYENTIKRETLSDEADRDSDGPQREPRIPPRSVGTRDRATTVTVAQRAMRGPHR